MTENRWAAASWCLSRNTEISLAEAQRKNKFSATEGTEHTEKTKPFPGKTRFASMKFVLTPRSLVIYQSRLLSDFG